MRIGYSLTTSEIVAAEHADYGDCAKFQITCPRCREAVFKGKRTSRTAFETHYFSHYHASTEEARECEMRVERMARKYLESIAIEGHGQTLGQFMAVLREAIVQGQAELGVIPYATLWRDAQRIVARPDFGIFEKPFRKITDRGLSDACHAVPGFNARDDLAAAISRLVPFQGKSLFWCRRQASGEQPGPSKNRHSRVNPPHRNHGTRQTVDAVYGIGLSKQIRTISGFRAK